MEGKIFRTSLEPRPRTFHSGSKANTDVCSGSLFPLFFFIWLPTLSREKKRLTYQLKQLTVTREVFFRKVKFNWIVQLSVAKENYFTFFLFVVFTFRHPMKKKKKEKSRENFPVTHLETAFSSSPRLLLLAFPAAVCATSQEKVGRLTVRSGDGECEKNVLIKLTRTYRRGRSNKQWLDGPLRWVFPVCIMT